MTDAKRHRKLYTEIRIEHSTKEQKKEFELKLDTALKQKGYVSRTEYIREQLRKLIKGLK